MSSGVRFDLAEGTRLARDVVDMLRPGCERIEVAGSIRRRQTTVGDIEIVAVPAFESEADGIWGETSKRDLLGERLADLRRRGDLVPRAVTVHRADGSEELSQRVGDRYQALDYIGIPVDLFIVRPPADWGVLFTIRTGPADWSHRLVTECQRRFNRVSEGRLLHLGKPVPCPDEHDFFDAIGQPWVEPWDRRAEAIAL